MIFTRRFGALAARPRFPDAPELGIDVDLDAELAKLTAGTTTRADDTRSTHDDDRRNAGESAA